MSELWWGAVQSDALLANGLPGISRSSSSPIRSPTTQLLDGKAKLKRRRKRTKDQQPKSLLAMMNTNIMTMKRVRHTHAKFAALNVNNSNNDDPESGGMGDGAGFGGIVGVGIQDDEGIGVMEDKVDELPWNTKFKGKRRSRGIEIGEDNAFDCLRWMSGKVLEHAGFQGKLYYCCARARFV